MATVTPAPTTTPAPSTTTSSQPFNIPAPPLPSTPDLSQYINIATQQVTPGFNDVVSATQQAGQLTAQNDTDLANQTLNTQSLLQKTYGDLANEFTVEQQQEETTANQQGNANIGSAQVAMAKSGVDQSAQGAFAAPVAQARADLQTQISNIAEKYGAKQSEIADTLASNLQDVQMKALQYQQAGNQAMADTLTQVANLKYQQQQQIVSLAQQMQSAETTSEQNAWKDYMDEVNAQHQQATLDVMQERLDQTATTEADTLSEKTAKDQQTVQTNYTKDLNSFATKLQTASKPNGITREALIAQLQEEYPQLDPQSIQDDVYGFYNDTYLAKN